MNDKKILLIDDEPQVHEVIGKILKDKGMIVESARSYDAGLEAIQRGPHDVIVLDVMLGGRSGLDLAKEIQMMPPPRPFVMILTNSINAEHIAEAMESDVTTFVQKAEHDPPEIAAMILKHFEERKTV